MSSSTYRKVALDKFPTLLSTFQEEIVCGRSSLKTLSMASTMVFPPGCMAQVQFSGSQSVRCEKKASICSLIRLGTRGESVISTPSSPASQVISLWLSPMTKLPSWTILKSAFSPTRASPPTMTAADPSANSDCVTMDSMSPRGLKCSVHNSVETKRMRFFGFS